MVIRILCSGKICKWNLELWSLESEIQHKESGIPLMIGIRLSSSTDKKSGIPLVQSRIQDFHEL